MIYWSRWILVFILFGGLGKALAKEDFDKELKRLSDRYESFLQRQKEDKQELEAHREAAEEFSKLRKEQKEAWEEARRAFQKQREKQERTESRRWEQLEKAWEKQEEKELEKNEALRQKYIKNREQLEDIRQKAKRIPPEEEVGLDNEEESTSVE